MALAFALVSITYIIFLLRFLVALYRECRSRRACDIIFVTPVANRQFEFHAREPFAVGRSARHTASASPRLHL